MPSIKPTPTEQTSLEQVANPTDDKGNPTPGAWLDSYLTLLASGLNWKKAAFAAWYNAPKAARQPKTMRELALLLNYTSEQVFYAWQKQSWFRESGIDKLRQSIFQKFIGDVDRKTIHAAMTEDGAAGVQARKLFYEQANLAAEVGSSEADPLHVWLHGLAQIGKGDEPKEEGETPEVEIQ